MTHAAVTLRCAVLFGFLADHGYSSIFRGTNRPPSFRSSPETAPRQLQQQQPYFVASDPAVLGAPNVDATYGNLLRGIMSSPDYVYNDPSILNSSFCFYYIGLSDLMVGRDTFDWTKTDELLATAASEAKHCIWRVFVHWPGRPLLLPQYLYDAGMTFIADSNNEEHPNHSDPLFLEAARNFSVAFGAKYDGHKSLAFVQAGLLGLWYVGIFVLVRLPYDTLKTEY
jgi:hypothetical protein